MAAIHAWLNEKQDGDYVQRNIRLQSGRSWSYLTTDFIVFRIDSGVTSPMPVADPYLPALAMAAMAEGQSLYIHAPVTREAVYNIREFQDAWCSWMPALFTQPIDIDFDEVVEALPPVPPRAIQAFSGGLDAHFTTWMHKLSGDRQRQRPLQRAVFAHGFDIARSEIEAFKTASDRARRVLETVEVSLSTVRTNIRAAININWEMLHGPALAATLGQFIPEYTVGLIGSSSAYNALRTPWGSNPITDQLMSGGAMKFWHDGAGYTRNDKIRCIANWPLASESLRVCWKGSNPAENCGVCGKCIRTALGFQVWGLPVPGNFKQDIGPEDIARCEISNFAQLEAFQEIMSLALRNGVRAPWRDALRDRLAKASVDLDNVVSTGAGGMVRSMPITSLNHR